MPVLHEPGVISLSDGAFIEVAPSLRLRVEASAAIVDDDWTQPPPPLSADAEEDLFRRSHGNPGSTRLLVEGVARGFYIKRSFEDELHTRARNALTKQASRDSVIVLHGQSGTGKSVALARLANIARTHFRVPLLFAVERIPEAADVDACPAKRWIARASAQLSSCVIPTLPMIDTLLYPAPSEAVADDI